MKLISNAGYTSSYSSSKKKILKAIDPETRLIAIAGGDGTIRKTVMKLLNKKLKYKRPIAILPYGTANNIAGSLGIGTNYQRYINNWKNGKNTLYDIGYVTNGKEEHYFLESFGLGLFPSLMLEMDSEEPAEFANTEEKIQAAVKKLSKITARFEPVDCEISYDGGLLQGKFLMVEVMNISRLGPKLELNPKANCGDGMFELIAVPAEKRYELLEYLTAVLAGNNVPFPIKPIACRSVQCTTEPTTIHVDDEFFTVDKRRSWSAVLLHNQIQVIV